MGVFWFFYTFFLILFILFISRHSNGAREPVQQLKSCFHLGAGSGASLYFWQCDTCSRKGSSWAVVEVFTSSLFSESHSLENHA